MAKSTMKNDDHEDNLPATTAQGGALAELMDEMSGLEGAGTSGSADDNVVPFLVLLQDMSPQTKVRDKSAYVEGAVPGCLLNRQTGELWTPDDKTQYYHNKAGQQLFLQPIVFQRKVNEWVPRDAGGGLVGALAHPAGDDITATFKAMGGREVTDPRDQSGRRKVWRSEAGNDLIDTRYHYANVVYDDGRLAPIVISFSSTGHQTSKNWMGHMRNSIIKGKVAPAWFKKYPLRAVERSNNAGTWFVMAVDDGEWIMDKEVRDMGGELYKSISTGVVQAAPDEQERKAADDDVPF